MSLIAQIQAALDELGDDASPEEIGELIGETRARVLAGFREMTTPKVSEEE